MHSNNSLLVFPRQQVHQGAWKSLNLIILDSSFYRLDSNYITMLTGMKYFLPL